MKIEINIENMADLAALFNRASWIRERFDFSQLSRKDQLELIRKDGWVVHKVENPTKEMWRVAIRNNPSCIMHHDDLDEDLYLLAVKKKSETLFLIKNPSLAVILESFYSHPYFQKFYQGYEPEQRVIVWANNNMNSPCLMPSFPWIAEFQDWFLKRGGNINLIPENELLEKFHYLRVLKKVNIL